MNKRIYNILKNDINNYPAQISQSFKGNGAIYEIFNDFFHKLINKDKACVASSIELQYVIYQNFPLSDFDLSEQSFSNDGVSFIFLFDKTIYTINFKRWKDGPEMHYQTSMLSESEVNYSA